MAKHIKARVELLPIKSGKGTKLAKVTFSEVTHISENFGGGQEMDHLRHLGATKVFLSGSVCLAHNGACTAVKNAVYSIGSYGVPHDKITPNMSIVCVCKGFSITIEADLWPALREAISAYNEFYKGE